jgi:hypothetical protein
MKYIEEHRAPLLAKALLERTDATAQRTDTYARHVRDNLQRHGVAGVGVRQAVSVLYYLALAEK